MRILFIVPYTPTLIRTRPYNLLRGLVRRGHSITLATLWQHDDERSALREFENQGVRVIAQRLTPVRSAWNMLVTLPTSAPVQAAFCWHPQLLRNLQSAIRDQQFDLVHVEHLRGSRYGLHLQSAIRNPQSKIPLVWDSVDCISLLFEQAAKRSTSFIGRWAARFELARTRAYEAMLVNQFDRVLVTSNQDALALENLVQSRAAGVPSLQPATCHLPPATTTALPNGVDLDYFSPSTALRDPNTIIFSGKMSYHANITAALYLVNDIMPLIWRERPATRLTIVGKDPSKSVRRLALRDSRIQVTGTVSDIRPFLNNATVAICPVQYGAGIQNKVLEPMACAIPVVASPQAVSALATVDGRDLLVAEGAEATARQVLSLLENKGLCERLGNAGRCYVERHHDWTQVVQKLEAIYKNAIDANALN